MSGSLKIEDSDELVRLLELGELPAYFDHLATLEKAQNTAGFYDDLLANVLKKTETTIHTDYPEWANIFQLECERTNVKAYLKKEPHTENSKEDVKALRWLAKCRDLKNHHIDFFFYFSGRSREKEISDILYQEKGGKIRLRKFYTKEPGSVYIPGIVRFFLRMYNIPSAAKLIWKARCVKPKPVSSQLSFSEKWIYPGIFLISLLALLAIVLTTFFSHAIGLLWPSEMMKSPGKHQLQLTIANSEFVPTYLTVTAFMFLLFVVLLFTRFKLVFRLLLPRMLSGILVGYIAMVFTKDVWALASRVTDPVHIIAIMLIAIFASAFFLANEVRNEIRHWRQVVLRSITVLALGLMQAFTIGTLVCDLFGKIMQVYFPPYMTLPGVFGEVYPQYVLITAPLSLLIGIFVQLIWDEKPISEPF